MTVYRPIREVTTERDGRPMRLIDAWGRERFGYWDRDQGVWVSNVDPAVQVRPVGFAAMPGQRAGGHNA